MEPSKKVRDAIETLSQEELGYEIERGKDSRFSRARPYMQKRFDQLEDEKEAQGRTEDRADRTKDRRIQFLVVIAILLAGLIPLCTSD